MWWEGGNLREAECREGIEWPAWVALHVDLAEDHDGEEREEEPGEDGECYRVVSYILTSTASISLTTLKIPKVKLHTRIPTHARTLRIPQLLQRSALEIHRQRKGEVDDSHEHNHGAEQHPPPPGAQQPDEEEAYRNLGQGGTHH